ncbi:hypothetical protein V8F06_012773 [Rhypophila decipiens]
MLGMLGQIPPVVVGVSLQRSEDHFDLQHAKAHKAADTTESREEPGFSTVRLSHRDWHTFWGLSQIRLSQLDAVQNNGYRGPLRSKLLSYSDSQVDMIGSLRDGKMVDNDHEGHSGEYLHQILSHVSKSIPAKPNVVLIHAGTNNMDKGRDIDKAPELMESIIEQVFTGSPNAVVLLAPVIWADKPDMQARTDVFNEQLGGIIERRQKAGDKILKVPIDITKPDLGDLKHPNDRGYQKMADAWFKAIQEANGKGWIKAPEEVDPNKLPGMGLGYADDNSGGEAANCEVGEIMYSADSARRDKVILADLNGDGIADYILADDDGTVRAWLNEGSPNEWMNLGTGPVRYADIDGDGKDDYLVVFGGGTVVAYINSCDWKLPDLGGGDSGGGGDDGLNYNSTCEDLFGETGNGNTYPSELWNKVGTQPYWKHWLSFGEGVTHNVVNEFAGEWGLTELGCNVGGNCEVPVSCVYEPPKGSARGHLVLRSIKNLHNYYSRLREDDLKDEDLANLLGTLEDAFGMAAAVSGSTSVGVANELFSAFSSTMSEAMCLHADMMYSFGFNFFNNSATAIDDLQNDLLREGHYEPSNGKKVILDDVFEDGQWIDTSKIPIINDSNDSPRIDPQALRKFFFAWFQANILNYSWRNSIVYVIGYPMTESEFDEIEVVDDAIKAYHWGYGYFLVSLGTRTSFGDTVYTRKEVPGYERVKDNDLNSGFTVEDVIKVSVDTFEEFGYNYTGSPVLDNYLNADWDTRRDVKPKVLGTFSLPICDLSQIPRDDVFRHLKELLADTEYEDSPMYGYDATCFCTELEDINGKKFRDQFPYSHNFDMCPPYTQTPYESGFPRGKVNST